jgi:hypothetical protein
MYYVSSGFVVVVEKPARSDGFRSSDWTEKLFANFLVQFAPHQADW